MSFGVVSGAVSVGSSLLQLGSTNRANREARRLQQTQQEFDMQRYQDWKDIYGHLQEDLGTYYENLTGETLVGKELEELQKSSQEYQTKIDETLASRGLEGSGLEAQLTADNIYNTETQKALSRSTADQRARDEKQKFLNIGLQQEAGIANSMRADSTLGSQIASNAGTRRTNIFRRLEDEVTDIIGTKRDTDLEDRK